MRSATPIGWSGRIASIGPGDPADPLGAADCERLGDTLIAQPVNSLSSLALALIGGLVLLSLAGVISQPLLAPAALVGLPLLALWGLERRDR